MKLNTAHVAFAGILSLLVGCSDGSGPTKTAAPGANSPAESPGLAAFNEANKIRSGRQEEAIALYTKAIEADPKLAEAYHNRGLSYAEMYDFKNAESDLEKAKGLGLDTSKLKEAIALAKQLEEMSR